MPKPRPPHLQRHTTRHGKKVWVVQIDSGPKTRIRGEFGSPEFDAAYRAIVCGERVQPAGAIAKGSLEWLWMLYRQSGAWLGLSLATRRQRENIMKPVIKTGGKEPLSRINKNAIIKGRDKRLATPSQAKHFVTTIRQMFLWAIEQPEIPVRSDPTAGISFKRSKNDKKDGFPVWFAHEITQYEARWPRGTRERVLFDIYQFTGLRRGDAAVVGKQHVRDDVIHLRTEKTGMLLSIAILPELQQTLDAGPLGEMCWFASLKGQPMAKESVGNFFKDRCVLAGIKTKSGHGVRKAAATEAADNGATHAELNAIFGWEGDQMASLYTKSANRKKLAAGAIVKLQRAKK